jgi:uncharacterized protein
MNDFDSIEIRRLPLARTFLQLLDAQPGRPLALFARRRVGKTFFLDRDLSAAAKDAGWVPVYADVWLHKSAPLDAINHALEEALDDAMVPQGAVGKAAKTTVKKIGALGASIDFGDEPKRRALPVQPELRFDALVARLAAQSGKRVLLMLDEIQTLSDAPNGEAIIATLRAVLQKRKREVAAVFTGSSQDALASLVVASGGPMYQFAQLLDFPVLDDSYLTLLANHFAKVHRGKKLKLEDLSRAFAHIGYKPALMKDLVKSMSAEGITDVDLALKHFVADERQVIGWRALLAAMSPIEKALLSVIAQGKPPLGKETLAALPGSDGANPTIAKVRVAIERLRRMGVLDKAAQGGYFIEDSLFADYVKNLPLGKASVQTPTKSPSKKS